MVPEVHIPPPSQRFRWRRWESYPYSQRCDPADPRPGALVFDLVMEVTAVARIEQLVDGRWRATCNMHLFASLRRSTVIDMEQEARDRLWAWAQRDFPRLLSSRPNEYGTFFGKYIYDPEA